MIFFSPILDAKAEDARKTSITKMIFFFRTNEICKIMRSKMRYYLSPF